MNRNRFKQVARQGLVILVLLLGISTGIVLDRQAAPTHADTSSTSSVGPNIQLINEAWDKIQKNYVDPSAMQTESLTYGALSGMVNALGDTGHSTFLTPQMVKSAQNYQRGQFEGIGAQIESQNGQIVIVAPFDDSPAQRAGLHAGDVILKVDGNKISGLPADQVVGKVLGPAGTSVTLTIFNPSTNKTFDVTIVRARIVINNVTWQKLPGTSIAHLRLAGFSQGVSRQLSRALSDMQQQGITSVILDLRNNPGGLLNEAINTASQFLGTGDVLLEQNAQGRVAHIAVRPGGVATQMPMVVLVNKGSASASEIVAGAIQDAQRGALVGETTFGTGTVLNQFALSDGSALMLAVEQWLTPNGRVIWHKGITPDQVVTLSPDTNILTPESERTLTAEQLQASPDAQLLKAINMLNRTAKNHLIAPTDVATVNAISDTQFIALELSWMEQFAFI
ncbi:MAG: S41 family peptidase [Chloroflexi bacterium]|nr:S41 family peptidase [Chloroflexota bacterium]